MNDTKRKPPAAGRGRKKGELNKFTRQVKEMVLAALDEAGGVEYLVRQAEANPVAFMGLVGKILPLQVNADVNADVRIRAVERRIVRPQD